MRKILIALLVLMMTIPLAMAEVEGPELIDPWKSGDAEFECEQAGGCGEFAYKFDGWDKVIPSGEYDVGGGNTINISNSDAYTFDWESEYPVCKVIVVAANSANIYVYNYEVPVYSDTGLVAPYDKEISHVTFCFNNGGGITEIPEFPTVALPIAAILGLAFFFQRRKE
jgi:hypothetical protein